MGARIRRQASVNVTLDFGRTGPIMLIASTIVNSRFMQKFRKYAWYFLSPAMRLGTHTRRCKIFAANRELAGDNASLNNSLMYQYVTFRALFHHDDH